jgi:type IX secretion system PorP/SprF family membrane protein
MTKRLFSFLLFLSGNFVVAQQAPLYNQYHFVPLVYNPSYAGFNEGVHVALIRNQKWGNYGEGFVANSLSVGTLLKDDKNGLGISLYNDYVGITSKLNAHLLYSYRLILGTRTNLRFGIAAGVVDNRIDFSNAIVTDPNDPLVINAVSDRKTTFDMNFGMNFNYGDFRVGVSLPQLLGSKLIYEDPGQSFYTLERQLVANLGYSWYINRDKGIIVNPEALIIYSFPGAPLEYGANLVFELEKIAWAGVGYKSNYAVTFNVGVNIVKNLKLGLAYDFQVNEVASYNSRPNAELMLKYVIPAKVQKVDDNSEFEKALADQQRQLDSLNNVIRINKQESENRINELENTNNQLTNTNQVLEDSLKKWPKNTGVVTNPVNPDTNSTHSNNTDPIIPTQVNPADVKTNSMDHFVELSEKDSPNGYYVICGAFAEKSNADAMIRKIKAKYPNSRIIFNKRNNLYYVTLYYSPEKGEGLAYASYKAAGDLVEETWILEYNRKP